MSRLEDIKPNAAVRGVIPDALATVQAVKWIGNTAVELTYKDPAGVPDNVVRIVTENGRTLKFTSQGFERE